MNTFPWLQDTLNQWIEMTHKQRNPHAILLSGAKGIAKLELAKKMAQIALCENLTPTGSCQQCSACHLYQVGNHTDLTVIKAEKTTIKVSQIRQLTEKINLSATRTQYKVIIIENAEMMNKASANALLKTLEEPPNKVIIILTCNDIGRLLATIKSRCVKMNIAIPEHSISYEWLKQQTDKQPSEIQLSLLLANGTPLQAKEILQNDTLALVQSMLDDLQQLQNNQTTVLEISKHWFSNELYENLPYIACYYLFLLKFNNGINTIQYSDGYNIDKSYSHIIDLEDKILNFVSNINKFIKRSETALKIQLLIEELLINWKNDFHVIQKPLHV